MEKYGVRIYPLNGDVILFKQTIKNTSSGVYVVDTTTNGDHREAHVSLNSDKDIADAVRTALKGGLQRS